MIEAVSRKHGHVNIIDIGGTERYWGIVPRLYLQRQLVTITIVNLPNGTRPQDHGPFRFVSADACALDIFENNSFHIAHSNSVVEHVGDWHRMQAYARELDRVAESFFVQTPNYWFPIEPHCMAPCFHWMPVPMRVWVMTHVGAGRWKKVGSTDEAVRLVESARLLNRAMLSELFPSAEILTERFLGLPKSLIAVKDAE